MNRSVIIILLLFLSAPLFSQHLFTARSVRRGEILNAYVYPSEGIESSRFSLVDGEGKIVSHSDGFTILQDGVEIESALMGIPSHIAPGKYTLKVFCKTAEGSDQFSKPFFVAEREYKTMDIELNGAMTDLRSGDDPRKAEQSRNLWALLTSFDEDAVHYSGLLETPVTEYFESAFYGDRRTYIYSDGSTSDSLHNGSDFAAPVGQPVFAVGDGRVVMAEFRILTGNTIVIEHMPGLFSLYYHLDSLSTEPDMMVRRGAEIGKVGKTGLVTGPHLHWEIRVSGVPVDPLRYMEVPLIDKDEILDIIGSIH